MQNKMLNAGLRETERLIEIGQFVDLHQRPAKQLLQQLLERYEREVSAKKRTRAGPISNQKYYATRLIVVFKDTGNTINSSDIAEFQRCQIKVCKSASSCQ